MTDWFAYTTFDIIGDMALGEPFGCLVNPDFRFWVPLISESIKAGAFEQATRRLAETDTFFQRFLLRFIPSRIANTRKQHLNYSREKILKRMQQNNNDHKDFLYYLMRQQDTDQLNQDEVIVNGALMIIAGTETTAGFLTGLFNLLLIPKNKHILDKLTQEIRSNFESDADLNFEALTKLPYLSAVLEEGLRIFPSAPIGFVRTVPRGGDTIVGEHIPGGTTVSVGNWASSHSERNFKDAYEFIPERWMDRKNATDKLHASNPFSLGPRGCIGKKYVLSCPFGLNLDTNAKPSLSNMEQRLIIAKLLWNSDVDIADHPDNKMWDPANDYENMVVYNNWIKPPLFVKLTPRKF